MIDEGQARKEKRGQRLLAQIQLIWASGATSRERKKGLRFERKRKRRLTHTHTHTQSRTREVSPHNKTVLHNKAHQPFISFCPHLLSHIMFPQTIAVPQNQLATPSCTQLPHFYLLISSTTLFSSLQHMHPLCLHLFKQLLLIV